MKKTIKTLIALVMVVFMFAAIAVPAMAEGFDFDAVVPNHSFNSLNSRTLEIGKTDSPTASVWAMNGTGVCYSSDESVVTVAANGTVTAVGEGTAYVAIVSTIGGGSMYEVYKYTVVAPAAPVSSAVTNTTSSDINNNGGGITTNASSALNLLDDEWEQNQNEIQQMYEDAKDNLLQQHQERSKSIFSGFFIIFFIALALMIAEIAYIYIKAPLCGMSRLWCLAPLVSNVIGLIVFIVVSSKKTSSLGVEGLAGTIKDGITDTIKGTNSSSKLINCPTCDSVHPAGTTQCNICGTKFL